MTKKEFKILIKECVSEILAESKVNFSRYKSPDGRIKWEHLDTVASMFPEEYSVTADAHDSDSIEFDFHTSPWLKAVEAEDGAVGNFPSIPNKYYLINYDENESTAPIGAFTIEELYSVIVSNKYGKPLGKRPED